MYRHKVLAVLAVSVTRRWRRRDDEISNICHVCWALGTKCYYLAWLLLLLQYSRLFEVWNYTFPGGEYGSGGGNEQLMILLGKEKDDQKVGRSVGRMHLRKVISVLLGVFLYYYTHTTPWDELLLTWHGRKQEGGGCPNGSHWVLRLKVIVLGSLLEIKQMPVWQFKIECQVHQGIIDV